MSAVRNLVNLSGVSKGYATRTVLADLTLGVSEGERIGVVGGNGQGKSTLLRLIAGIEQPDEGAVIRLGALSVGWLSQADELHRFADLRRALVGERAEHEWASDRGFRDVLAGLLGGMELSRLPSGWDTPIGTLSGGERRRIDLARLLLEGAELLLLDEPTNHLDVEAISWLAGFLAARRGTVMLVTHDRWFLDAVCTATWELAGGRVHRYEGGYAAYVLARAERDRMEAAQEDRRRQLVRKELAWLRRGPPARTSKPKFRIEAANALIADEPAARDRVELLRFSSSRLGDRVLEAEDVSFAYRDGAPLLARLTWRLGPGDRVAVTGANGSGKSTLLKLLAGELEPTAGRIARGTTVRLAHLSQHTEEVPGHLSVIEALEQIRKRVVLAGGQELTAGRLSERFGFRGDAARTPVEELSGGERRRLALMRLLMGEPNVLLLDEPTNDLDIDTLTALEDLLDGWPGTLVVVSHDRYFIERVCDDVYALAGAGGVAGTGGVATGGVAGAAGGIRHVPGGIEQYLHELKEPPELAPPAGRTPRPSPGQASRRSPGQAPPSAGQAPRPSPGAELRTTRKDLRRLERELERLGERERALHTEMADHASDHQELARLSAQLEGTVAERERLEEAWLEAAESLPE